MRRWMALMETAGGPDAGLVAAAVAQFGLTSDPREIGYLLADGRCLDLSGRHQVPHDYVRGDNDRWRLKRAGERDWMAGQRPVDHRDLGDLVATGGTAGMLEFMRRSGAIRVLPDNGFTLLAPPTPVQLRALGLLAEFYALHAGSVHVDCDRPDGTTIASKTFDLETLPRLRRFLATVRWAG